MPPKLVLDGSARRANEAGEVTEASLQKVTVDGKRTYTVPSDLACFSASTLKAQPLLARKGTFVHMGVAGGTVRWIAGYSAVVRLPGKPAVAYHLGALRTLEGRTMVLKDGSVLPLADGVNPPKPEVQSRFEIDVATHKVTAVS